MFSAIASAVKQFFNALTTLCSAFDHTAKALDHLAITGEETAAQFSDEARMKRAAQMVSLKAELKAVENKAAPAKAA